MTGESIAILIGQRRPAGVYMLLAQSSEAVAWTSVVASIVQLGFAALVAWYLITRTLPSVVDTFSKLLREEREIAMAAELRRETGSKERLALMLADNKEALARVLEHCERETARRDQIMSAEMSTINRTMMDVGEALERQNGKRGNNRNV